MKVIIGGDIYPAGKHLDLFMRGSASAIFGPLLPEFLDAQCVAVNLESPLYDGDTPIFKSGPALKAPTECINAFKNAHIDLINLCNNHALDHGEAGLRSTIETCTQNGLLTLGAGPNLSAARQIQVIEVEGIRIGFLGLAEHEFSIATDTSWGVNPLDMIHYVRTLRANRGRYDYLIVLLHGGAEDHPYPNPRLQEVCRFLVEEGAKVVVCQHSHCPGCYEQYLGGHIVYGQGNLIFPGPPGIDAWHEGFLVKLEIQEHGSTGFSIVPFQQTRKGFGVSRFTPEQEERFLSAINSRSRAILDNDHVKAMWKQYCKERRHFYISAIVGHGRLLTKVNHRGGLITRMLYSKQSLLTIRNLLTCESLNEALETILESEARGW